MKMMSQVCHNVIKEPQLQPLSWETFSYGSASTEDGPRSADIYNMHAFQVSGESAPKSIFGCEGM